MTIEQGLIDTALLGAYEFSRYKPTFVSGKFKLIIVIEE